LESATNQGDTGDSFPGSGNKKSLTKSTSPNTLSYGGVDTLVSLKNISASAPTMSADIAVK
jgi:immune inhibitor A